MFPLAGQTAGTNGLTFLVDTYRKPGGEKGSKNFSHFFPFCSQN